MFRRSTKNASEARPPTRWWPLWLILALGLTALVTVQMWPEWSHQQRNIARAQVIVFGIALLMVWAVLFSRWRWRTRLSWLGAIVGTVLLLCLLFRIRGVSGDLRPILSWRFQIPGNAGRVTIPSGSPLSKTRTLPTGDFPQFLGPARNAVLTAPLLATNWVRQAPTLLWRRHMGAAWSGFAISGNRALTQEQRGEEELVSCYDLFSGDALWTHADTAHYHTTIAGEGPRATPTISGARAYTMGATGLLNCLDLATGRVLWTKNVPAENGGEVGEWGVSCSPLIVGETVVVTTGAKEGNSMVAYQTSDGAAVWHDGHDRSSYSSPISESLLGLRQILIFNSSSVMAHDAQTGTLLWRHPWPTGHPHITTPMLLNDHEVVVSSGYGIGSELLRISRDGDGKWKAERRWKSNRLKSKFANLIQRNAFIYGLDDGILVCLDGQTGDLKWKDGRYGHGQLLLVGNVLLIMAEDGEVALVDPEPDQRRELARFQALRGKTWNPPALAGQCLVLRNDQEAACYALAVQAP